jgi:hypothetical protein
MPWVEALTNPQELRRFIRDLVALSTLPAIAGARAVFWDSPRRDMDVKVR